jgi:hypothetical protein
MLAPCARRGDHLGERRAGAELSLTEEAAMGLDGTVGSDVDEALLGSGVHWLDGMPPELEWDESEVALLVEQITGRYGMGDN